MLNLSSAIAGFIAVALGAFGAHALQDGFSPQAVGWWQTATQYLFANAVAGLAIGLSGRDGALKMAGLFMVYGAGLFALTLYAMALGAPRFLGAITPIGGLVMLTGWGLAVASSFRS